MPTMSEPFDNTIYALFKGEPGTRKSTAALSFPTPQYWFSADKKMTSLRLPMYNWGIKPADIVYDDYTNFTAVRDKLEKFQTNCPFKTLIFDSVTSIGDITNSQTMLAKSGTKNKQGEEKGAQVGGISINSLEDYKAEASAFNQLIALTKDIKSYHKINIVLIAHVIGERKPQEKKESTHFARIIVTGGKIISAKIPAYCEEVYHFNVEPNVDAAKEDDYGLVTRHSGDDFARTGLPLPRKIVFGNQPLYENFIKPAIEKLNQQHPK